MTTLSEAIAFTRQVRESWSEQAKGYVTTKVNANHALRILGDVDIATIKAIHIVQLQQKLKAEGKTPATCNRVVQALKTVLNTMVKFEMLEKVPHSESLKEPPGRTALYSDEEIERLLAVAWKLPVDAEVMHDATFFAVKTGCRQSELLKLRWTDVNFEQRLITFTDTKNGQNRVLPMTDTLIELLQSRFKQRIDDDVVFPIHKDSLYRRFNRMKKMAGITNKDLNWHCLRHYCCSKLHEKGAPLPAVMLALGHSQMSTANRYAHSNRQGVEKALALL